MIAENGPINKLVLSMLENGQSRNEIETLLLDNGHDAGFVKELVAETVKLRELKRRTLGWP